LEQDEDIVYDYERCLYFKGNIHYRRIREAVERVAARLTTFMTSPPDATTIKFKDICETCAHLMEDEPLLYRSFSHTIRHSYLAHAISYRTLRLFNSE